MSLTLFLNIPFLLPFLGLSSCFQLSVVNCHLPLPFLSPTGETNFVLGRICKWEGQVSSINHSSTCKTVNTIIFLTTTYHVKFILSSKSTFSSHIILFIYGYAVCSIQYTAVCSMHILCYIHCIHCNFFRPQRQTIDNDVDIYIIHIPKIFYSWGPLQK